MARKKIGSLDINKNSSVEEVVKVYEKKLYDLQQMLEISQSLCSTLEYSTLIESILYTCMAQMLVLGAGIFVLEEIDTNAFSLANNYTGIDVDPDLSYTIPFSHPVIDIISQKNRVFTLKEVQNALPKETNLDFFTSLRPSLIVPLFQKNHINGILLLGERMNLDGSDYTEYDRKQILSIAPLISVAINNAAMLERSSIDMMTHLKLKYFFFNALTDKLDLSISQDMPLSVIMFDIDFFKKFNDTWGHACGDYVLVTVAKIMKSSIREGDMASRYGGEEFTIMLPNTAEDDAIAVAERIRKAIEEYDFFYENNHLKVTISGGVSIYDSETNPVTSARELVEQADKALYSSKENGRNRITYITPEAAKTVTVEKK